MVMRGTFLVIRTNGVMRVYIEKPTIAKIHHAIGCRCVDTVTLSKDRDGRS
jgi:hypothetical protein